MTDLTSVLRETLQRQGLLDELRAKVRAEVFAALEDRTIERPTVPSENLLINELIREYLLFNGYHHSLATLLKESRQPEQPLDKDFLRSELHLEMAPGDLPLMYGIVGHFTDQHQKERGGGAGEEASPEGVVRQPCVTVVRK